MSLPRLLAGAGNVPMSRTEHERVHGSAPRLGEGLIEQAAAAGLRGRGGAGFPIAVKLRSVAAQRGPRVVLVNGAEGEPMSAKDRMLMHLAPHLVLDGAVAAADAVGARRIVLAVRDDAAGALAALRVALTEAGLERRVQLRPVPGAYLTGQETALISFLEGGQAKPTTTPPLPYQRGIRRRPTLVQNPETLAHLALIARHGARWFRELGTAEDPGSALVTIGGAVRSPGVTEIACGVPLTEVLAAAGGIREPLRAVLVGGYHGGWIGADDVAGVTLDDLALHPHGASLAAGVVVALPTSTCGARELARAVRWLAGQSAGQCGPCTHGLPAIAAMLEAMVNGRAPRGARERLQRWSDDLPARGACHLPDGTVRFLAGGLRVFAAEIADHERHGPCDACPRPPTLALPRTLARAA